MAVAACVVASLSCTTAPAPRFDVTTVLDKSIAHVGDSVAVTITIANVSGVDQTIPIRWCAPFVVLDSSRAQVGPPPRICTLELSFETVPKGGTWVIRDGWDGRVNATGSGPTALATPGVYAIDSDLFLGAGTTLHGDSIRIVP